MTWYKPFTWFSGTDTENTDSKDSTYEEEVKERCDHTFEQTTSLIESVVVSEARIVGDYLVFPQYERVEEYCQDCGVAGFQGEPDRRTYVPAYEGEWTRVANTIAIPLHRLDPGADPTDALAPGYAVDEAGETTVIEGEGEGRVLVNESEQDAADAATDAPAKAGGPTDD